MVYSVKYDGYIADNPNLDFERCDGTVFSFYEVNSADMNSTSNTLPIQGGQGKFPLAIIDTDKTQEFTFASSQFSLDMFLMANATKVVEGDVGTLESKRFEVKTGLTITLPFEVQPGSVKIRGLEEGDEDEAGEFGVVITPSTDTVDGATEITLNAADVATGDTVRVAYRRRVVGAQSAIVKTSSTTAKGALSAHWPVYSAGTDCAEASVKGWLHLFIPRVRVTALPGFQNTYKSASTNSVTFSAIDPKLGSEKMYALSYEPLDEDGELITKSSGEVDWN